MAKDLVVAAAWEGGSWVPVAWGEAGDYDTRWFWAQDTGGCKLIQRFYKDRTYSGAVRVPSDLQMKLVELFK